MGAIAGAFDKRGTAASDAVLSMLEELEHRATGPPRVVGHPGAFVAQSMGKMRRDGTPSKVAVGTNSSEPVLGPNHVWILEGRFFQPPQSATVHRIMHEMARRCDPLKTSRRVLRELDGSYVFAFGFADRIVVGRDTVGVKPLYYGENRDLCAIASERKALWRIGINNARSFPPGNLATINEHGFAFEAADTLEEPGEEKVKMPEAVDNLRRLLEESIRERVTSAERVAVAFSGGLDSSVIAFMAKGAGVAVHLISVGLEGQREIEDAEEAAEALALPLTPQTHTVKDVEKTLPKVLWLIEEPDAMKASVAIAFYWTAQIASKLGCDVLLAGQGADELFGGYHKYLTQYAQGGYEKVREALYHDTVRSHEVNFQRDEPVCAFHGVDLRLPFCDIEIVRYALSLPLSLKIESAGDKLRKRVLRRVAASMGVPEFVANKPKKAVQFATGIDKALRLLAKKQSLTLRAYVEEVFRQVYPNREVEIS